jgi:hypothetical protein
MDRFLNPCEIFRTQFHSIVKMPTKTANLNKKGTEELIGK